MFKIESYTVYNGTSKTFRYHKMVANLEAERAILEAKHQNKILFCYKVKCAQPNLPTHLLTHLTT